MGTMEYRGYRGAVHYSGRIPLRIDSALHRRVAIAADSEAKSVNRWIAEALEVAAKRRRSDAATNNVTAKKMSTSRKHSSRRRISKAEAEGPTSAKKQRTAARKASR